MTPATRSAVEVARRLGIESEHPVLVQKTNNTVVWLRPHPVIAKVGTRPASADSLPREHQVAKALARLGAPVAEPLPGTDPVRDDRSGFTVTLWRRLSTLPDADQDGHTVGRSLAGLHRAFDECELALPNFRNGLEDARRALFDDSQVGALEPIHRSFLRAAFTDLKAELDARSFPERSLHGEPHQGNYVVTTSGLRWIDFEGACTGPLEWDLAFLPDDGAARSTTSMVSCWDCCRR